MSTANTNTVTNDIDYEDRSSWVFPPEFDIVECDEQGLYALYDTEGEGDPAPTNDLVSHVGWYVVAEMGYTCGTRVQYLSLAWAVAEALVDFSIGGASWRAE